jgi:hypothetical protein
MPVTVRLGKRRRLSVGHSRENGWWAVRWRKPPPTGWEDWDPRWDDDSPGGGVREPRRPPPSPLHGAAELPEPD